MRGSSEKLKNVEGARPAGNRFRGTANERDKGGWRFVPRAASLYLGLIALTVAALGAIAGNKYNVLEQLNAFPRIPVDEGDLTTGGIIALIAAVLVPLVGAILGGLAGMRFHRKVDKTGLGH